MGIAGEGDGESHLYQRADTWWAGIFCAAATA
jgi:hypothetical protein